MAEAEQPQTNTEVTKDTTSSNNKFPEFDLGPGYTILDIIGEGAYGTIISILDIHRPKSFKEFDHVYIIQELMETDLHRVIRSHDLSDDHCQYFIYQTLRALKYIHSANVVHRDLKPSNLLLNSNCDLKVCDFGLARGLSINPNDKEADHMTEYVATRWYRAPEIMLSYKNYSKAIDIWSVGCILAEILSKKPLFPGKDYYHQLELILNTLGTPSMDDYCSIKSRRAREYVRTLPLRKKANFYDLFPNSNPLAIDLMEKMLTFNPNVRITAEEALKHPYLAAYYDPTDEPVSPPVDPRVFLVDRYKDVLSHQELKVLLWEEINS
ncbi:hypothetical protein BB560_004142 [Smittium megazygosporum]|uniref:mitogen-activated protein kinase n=1 Tax=Smittium megazygosporum TaxID=133381 RepID=A0A2T9ZA11_9FUNG|nr:hypothetical protein BB560_004142 [Smittium megazygosporum]